MKMELTHVPDSTEYRLRLLSYIDPADITDFYLSAPELASLANDLAKINTMAQREQCPPKSAIYATEPKRTIEGHCVTCATLIIHAEGKQIVTCYCPNCKCFTNVKWRC